MSDSNIDFNNIVYTNGKYTIIVGDMNIQISNPNTIDIKPVGQQIDSHLIFAKNDDTIFKEEMQHAPTRNFDITIYDHYGHISGHYKANRKDNSVGTVKITERKDLLSNIEFPKIESGQIYLCISKYNALDQFSVPTCKRDLVIQDLELLKQKIDTNKIILFISEEINTVITQLGIDLSKTFQAVLTPPLNIFIQYIVEYLVGKNISITKSSFQGVLKFEAKNNTNANNISVVMSHLVKYELKPTISSTICHNGIIKIKTATNKGHARFFIMLKHPENIELQVSEKTTNTIFELTYRNLENLPDLTDEHFKIIIDALIFLENINTIVDYKSKIQYISDNYNEAGKYNFNSPLNIFEELKSKSEQSSIIIEYACILRKYIYQQLNNYALIIFSRQSSRKKVFFTDTEFSKNNITQLFTKINQTLTTNT